MTMNNDYQYPADLWERQFVQRFERALKRQQLGEDYANARQRHREALQRAEVERQREMRIKEGMESFTKMPIARAPKNQREAFRQVANSM